MKILINCSNLKKGGVLQVGHSLVSELLTRTDNDYYFVLSSTLSKDFPGLENLASSRVLIHDVRPTIYLALTGREKTLDAHLKSVIPDAVFSVFGPTYWKPSCLHVVGYAKAVYFYPDSPFIQKMPLIRKSRLFFLKQFHMHDFRYFNHAIVTETSDTSQRLASLLPSKDIFTVSNTYNQIFDQPEKWDNSIVLPEFDGITLISITANYRHKNLSIIPKVISYLRAHHPSLKFRFVLTLNRNEFDDLGEEDARHIVFLGRVSIHQCPSLYQQSDIMFMPTLLECFSATYPEAMKMGISIITSDLPFARAVCEDAAIYFDPVSPQSIGKAIYSLSQSESLRKEMVKKGEKRLLAFETSESRATKYIEIIESLYEANYSKS